MDLIASGPKLVDLRRNRPCARTASSPTTLLVKGLVVAPIGAYHSNLQGKKGFSSRESAPITGQTQVYIRGANSGFYQQHSIGFGTPNELSSR